ncbi:MAG: hypothetical protein CMM15_13465 [Rhodospirillaceae bacterium]|nr:hypothetical protein [Rhodospirillaceae bacterium]|tara:strand:+ start:2836 stop:3027 length:192 start_codon:yes stop_codon:yes gene_type:complete
MYQGFLLTVLIGIFICLIVIVIYVIKYYTLFKESNESFTSISRNFQDVSFEIGNIIHEEKEKN